MAAPRNRRAGYSRKAQLQLFTGYLLAYGGAMAGLLLLALSWFDPGAFSALRNGAADLVSPVTRNAAAVRNGIKTGWQESSAYFNAASKNAQLERDLKKARKEAITLRAVKHENRQLRELLGLVEEVGKPVATTRLINSSASSSRRLATIAAGYNQGVRRGQPVLSENGLIGRILDTGRLSARVLLLTDVENVVPVKRAKDGVVAFSQGRGDGLVDLRLINVGINPLKKGDVLVTSGNGGIYPPNVPVARVIRLTSDGAIAELVANPAATNYVIVERIFTPVASALSEDGTAKPASNEDAASGTASDSPDGGGR